MKLINYKNILVVDLSHMTLGDEDIKPISEYVGQNTDLRSLSMADNNFTDRGMLELINALRVNTHLNHLNILRNKYLTEESLSVLEEMVSEINMSMYSVEIDTVIYKDPEITTRITHQAGLNRAIQENLKPVKV